MQAKIPYLEMEADMKAARDLILVLWGWNALNKWNEMVNNRIAEKLRGEAADTPPDLLFLDYSDGNGELVILPKNET